MSKPDDASGGAPNRRRGIFYGWWIVVAGGLGMSITAGINFHGFGNFIIPLTNEFGWNRTTISGVFSLARLESGLLGPLEGWLVDRVGPRRLMLVGVPLMGVGYILMSRIDSLAAFFVVYIFAITLGNSLGMSTPMAAAVANWFNRKRGLAFGIMWSGVGLGGFFVPAIGWLIAAYDWRIASIIIGVFTIVMGVPIAALMRHRPEPYGYMPDGASPEPSDESGAASRRRQPDLSQDFTAREALMTSSFWYLTLSIAARSLVSGGVGLHLVPYFVDLGASDVFAATLAGSVGVMSIPGRFGLSWASDYLNRRIVMAVSLFLMTIAIVFMARAESVSQAIPFIVLYSAAQGGISVIPQSLIAEYFGRRAYATIQGFRGTIQMIGIIIGPLVSGYVFDTTGSYEWAFLGFGGATLVSLALVLMMRPPVRPQRIRRRD
ncbi:MAG: MFS transporter [Chloroflexi bacterium]|nr:MFS transporter [Chloroflexota bacterium]